MSYAFDTPGAVTLALRVRAGRVELETQEGTESHVELTPLRDDDVSRAAVVSALVELRHEGGGTTLYVEVPRSSLDWLDGEPEVHVVVRAPHGVDLRASTSSADIAGRGRFGAIQVKTASGDIALDDVMDADVKAASGDLHLGQVRGEAKVQSASGDVHVVQVQGPAKAQTASGDVTVERADGDLKIKTASGDQRIGCVREGRVTLQSASGDLDIGIQRGSTVWIDAKSMSGEARSDLDVGEAPSEGEGPHVELCATAMSGDITVARAAAVPS